MKLTCHLKKSILITSLSLSTILWPIQTRAMELMDLQWSKNPETILKQGETAKFDGVLVPDLNYRNYKTYEQAMNDFSKELADGDLPDKSTIHIWQSPVLWAVIGIVVGGMAVEFAK